MTIATEANDPEARAQSGGPSSGQTVGSYRGQAGVLAEVRAFNDGEKTRIKELLVGEVGAALDAFLPGWEKRPGASDLRRALVGISTDYHHALWLLDWLEDVASSCSEEFTRERLASYQAEDAPEKTLNRIHGDVRGSVRDIRSAVRDAAFERSLKRNDRKFAAALAAGRRAHV